MKKLTCECGYRNFNIDKENPCRINCAKCGQHYAWIGEQFVKTTKMKRILQTIERILKVEEKPTTVKLEIFKETAAEKELKEVILREKKAARARSKGRDARKVIDLVLFMNPKPTKKIGWTKAWLGTMSDFIEEGIFKINKHDHVGSIRGKHILKEIRKSTNFLGYKSRINFSKNQIIFLGDKKSALKDLKKIGDWRKHE